VLYKLKGGVMSSTFELIETFCPGCGKAYAHWERPTLELVTPPACPYCGHDPTTDRLIHEDGLWSLTAEEEETAER
jgi:hypothetical protein